MYQIQKILYRLIIILIFFTFVTTFLNMRIQNKQSKIQKINKEIREKQEKLQNLNADWNYLRNKENIKSLSLGNLEQQNNKQHQNKIESIPFIND